MPTRHARVRTPVTYSMTSAVMSSRAAPPAEGVDGFSEGRVQAGCVAGGVFAQTRAQAFGLVELALAFPASVRPSL